MSQKPLIVVDVQHEYTCSWDKINKLAKYINKYDGPVFFLYNGDNTGITDCSESDLKNYPFENGVKEYIIDRSQYFDKGYGYYRDLMDNGVDRDHIICMLNVMQEKGYYEIEEIQPEDVAGTIDKDELEDYIRKNSLSNAELLDDDMLSQVKRHGCIVLGGAEYECLAEFQIYLDKEKVQYETNSEFVYNGNYGPSRQKDRSHAMNMY